MFDWADGIIYGGEKKEKLQYNYIGKSIVSSVKNQGNCGSCYAFATVGVIESCNYLSSFGFGELKELSVQQIIDCTSSDPDVPICNEEKLSKACGGGDLTDIVNSYFSVPRKIAFNNYYPYTSFYDTVNVPGTDHSIQLRNYDFNSASINCNSKINSLDSYYSDYVILDPIITIVIESNIYIWAYLCIILWMSI